MQQRPIPQVTLYLIRQKPQKSNNFKLFNDQEEQNDHICQRQQSINKNMLKSKQKVQADQEDQENPVIQNQNFNKRVQLNPFQLFDQQAVEISKIQQQKNTNQIVQFNNEVQQENNQNQNQNFHQNLNLILQLLDVSIVGGLRQISQTSSEDIQQMLRQMGVDLDPFYQRNLPNEQRERIALRIAKFLQEKRMQNHLSTIDDLYNGSFRYVPSKLLVESEEIPDFTPEIKASKKQTLFDMNAQPAINEYSIEPQIRNEKAQYPFNKSLTKQDRIRTKEQRALKILKLLQNDQIVRQQYNSQDIVSYLAGKFGKYLKIKKIIKYKQIQKSKTSIVAEKCKKTVQKTIKNSTGPAVAIYTLKTGTDVLIKKKEFKQTVKQNAKQSYLNYSGNIVAKVVGSVLPYGGIVAEKIINEAIPHFTNKQSRNKIRQAYRNRRNNRNQ